MVAFIENTLRGKVSGENFDESIASRQNSSDFSPVKILRYTVSLLAQTTSQNRAKLLEMVTYALKIVPWNEWVNKSNFEKWPYGGF